MDPKCSHKFLYKGGRGRSDTEKGNVIPEARCYLAGFKDGGRGHESRNDGKGKETDSLLETPGGTWP